MDINLVKNKMDIAINFFEKEISSIRTSRANPSILDNILVESYGNRTPINQLGTISSPDANLITIQVWDTSLTNLIEKAISESNIGINPQTEGQLIRLPIPKLSEERRQELAKLVSQYAEQSKIAIRNNRRDFLDKIKKDNKDKLISEDDFKKYSNQVQEITDEYISKIDEIVTNKQSEIMKV